MKPTKNGRKPRTEGRVYKKRRGWEEGPNLVVRLYKNDVELKKYEPGIIGTWLERKPRLNMVCLHAKQRQLVFPNLGIESINKFSMEPNIQPFVPWVVYSDVYVAPGSPICDFTIVVSSPLITLS